MWRAIASNALTLFVVGLFLLAGVVMWGQTQYRAAGPLEQAICLEVPSGATMRSVGNRLDGQGAFSSRTIFNVGVDYSGKASQLKAGRFIVPAGSSMEEIVEIVTGDGVSNCGKQILYRVGVNRLIAEVRETNPETNRFDEIARFVVGEDEVPAEFERVANEAGTVFRVAIAEGATSWQVYTALNAIDALGEDATVIPSEGSLAPDSYEFTPGDSVQGVLDRMAAAQVRILDEAWENRADDLPISTKEEALILASIIEKETAVAGERPLVASVFVNRLRQGMRLQTDPTVIYGITGGEGVLGRGLRRSELDRETPYNTYIIPGLPPTPIANPGAAAINAALNPDDSDYIFFVADGTGGHAFAVTLAEHNENVARWRQIEAERAANSN